MMALEKRQSKSLHQPNYSKGRIIRHGWFLPFEIKIQRLFTIMIFTKKEKI
jgi:hypothetical protein